MNHGAIRFLRFVLKVSSPDNQDWGRAMLAEVHYLGSAWETWHWALACSVILLRRTMTSKLSQIWHTNVRANAFAVVCLGLAAILVLIPTFRQGMNAVVSSWNIIYNSPQHNTWGKHELDPVIQRAETERDAKTLAFAAERYPDAPTAARLADAAVTLDPSLTWIYAVVGDNQWRTANIPVWIDKLHRWAPNNGFVDLMAAEEVDIRHAISGNVGKNWQFNDQEWQQAMDGAFHSSTFDDYATEQLALDREVASSQELFDPMLFVRGYADGFYTGRLPSNASADVRLYARMLVAQGKYQEIDHFGQLLRTPGQSDETAIIGWGLADTMVGKNPETPWLSPTQQVRTRERFSRMHADGQAWGSRVRTIQISGLLVVIFTLMLGLSLIRLLVRPSSFAAHFVAISAAAILVSATSLYLSYRPYAVLFDQFLQSGNWPSMRVFEILASARPPFLRGLGIAEIHFYTWTAIIVMCSAVILWIVGSNALRRMHAARP